MTTTRTRNADPALMLVRERKRSREDADRAQLVAVLDWAVEHTTDADPHAVTFGERPMALGGVGCPVLEEFAVYDLAAALSMSTEACVGYLGSALELRHRLPRLWKAVCEGRVAVWRATRIAGHTMGLPVAGAAYVDDRLAPAVGSVSFAQVERLVQEALVRFDPAAAEAERVAAAEDRCVRIELDRVSYDGTVRMDGVLDLADALDLEDAVRAGARALGEAGSSESLDARRAMALGELARGDQSLPLSAGRELVVHVHQDSPDLARCETTRTPISVEQVRGWCAAFTKVTIKPVIDLNQRIHVEAYEAPDRLRDQIILRDVHCVFPSCRRPARGCDLDHVIPFDAGGATASDNLAPLCRRHHRAKTHGTWDYHVVQSGTYHWTAPSGLTYRRDHQGTHPLDDPAEP